jgi:hypothetical protein
VNGPEARGDRARLAGQIAAARLLLTDPGQPAGRVDWARRCGALEAMLQLVCDTAETVAAAGSGQ